LRRVLAFLGFLTIAILAYSPLLAPYKRDVPYIFGLPYTLFNWFLLNLILLIGILIFSLFWKPEK